MSFIENLSLDQSAPEDMEFYDSLASREVDTRDFLVEKMMANGLTREQARVVALRIFDEITFQEIARQTGIASAQSAFNIYTGAIRHLKEKGYK